MKIIVNRVIYSNKDNGYTVINVINPESGNVFNAVGKIPSVGKGMILEVDGYEKYNEKYNQNQFMITQFVDCGFSNIYGLKEYMKETLYGVGEKFATEIVNRFGLDTIRVMDEEPEKIKAIARIGEKNYKKIIDSWIANRTVTTIIVGLQQYGVTTSQAFKIFRVLGTYSLQQINSNPYILTKVRGIGFKFADDVALNSGMDPNDDRRLIALTDYVIYTECSKTGNSYIPINQFYEYFCKYIGMTSKPIRIEYEKFKEILYVVRNNGGIVLDKDRIYFKKYYDAEVNISNSILNRLYEVEMPVYDLTNYDINFSDDQLDAIRMCLSNNFSIVTGIAGTGKTSIIKAVVDIFESNNMKCLLCTPTGRAARRLSEVTDHEAQTVHSAYKIFPLEERDEFAVSEYKRTEDVLIIDEFSMIELIIFNIVLEKTSSNTKIILVGDPKQLPSVGVGSLLKDFIESKKIPVHNLTQIFRQGKNSKIIETAFDINRGVMPEIPTIFEYNNQDIVFFEQKDSSKILDTIQIIIEKFLLERGYSNNDINIISPLRRFDLGSIELNKYLKNILKLYKFDSDEINGNIFNFSLGDKVIQTRNIIDYGCGSDKPVRIYNGDIGIITEINDSECNVLFYDSNNVIQYNKGNMDDIELAYAISVHKSQGSEYPIIILICHENVGRMLRRDIYYTGVTRAKNLCIFVGTKSALKTAIKNDYELKRYSYMKERLNGKQD